MTSSGASSAAAGAWQQVYLRRWRAKAKSNVEQQMSDFDEGQSQSAGLRWPWLEGRWLEGATVHMSSEILQPPSVVAEHVCCFRSRSRPVHWQAAPCCFHGVGKYVVRSFEPLAVCRWPSGKGGSGLFFAALRRSARAAASVSGSYFRAIWSASSRKVTSGVSAREGSASS